MTMGRVVLGGVFFAMLAVWSYDESPLATGTGGAGRDPWLFAAAAVFVLAAVTDALDGHLARKWGVVSVFGRVMDPFADKVLVIGAFVMLCGPGFMHAELWWPGIPPDITVGVAMPGPFIERASVSHVAPWMVVVIVARELLVTSIRGIYESRGVSFAATMSGKGKMILQCACVPLVLVLVNFRARNNDVTGDWASEVIRWTVWVTVAVTAWSGVPYVVKAVRESGKLREGKG